MSTKNISRYIIQYSLAICLIAVGGFPLACGSDNAAVERGVGSECKTSADCTEEGQECLDFKGGYCGIEDCTSDDDCPDGSACVAHDDGVNYCFLICIDKPDCNDNRSEDVEANCSANIVFVDNNPGVKACVPPSAS